MNDDANPTARPRPQPLDAGQVIDGRYRLVGKLGEGGMGEVWAAEQTDPVVRAVAVKFLHLQLAAGPDASAGAIRRFVAEANVTARLQHPGVPPIHHVGELPDGRPFLVMKLISGRALDALLAVEGPGAARWLAAFEAICHAVGYAHSQGIIHRDLKPQNVMVGAFGEVQVMDWGLARVRADEYGARNEGLPNVPHATIAGQHLTRVGSALGTLAYMPPEQAAGEWERVDERADVFGLGAVLCALLTGQPPYIGDPSVLHLRAVSGDTKEAFARLDRCGAAPEVVALCKRCLSFEPDDRPTNGAAVADAVAALRQDAEERGRRAELDRTRADEYRKRSRLAVAGLGLLAVVLAAGVVGTAVGLRRAERARDAESDVRGKAEETRDRIRGFFDTMYGEVNSDLIGDPRALAEKAVKLNTHMLAVYRVLAAEEVTDEASRRRVAVALYRCGSTESTLGDRPAAVASFTAACREFEVLAAAQPGEVELQRGLGDSHTGLGRELENVGRKVEAEEHYRRGLAIRARIAEGTPTAEARAALGHSHHDLGELLGKTERPDEGTIELEKALDIRRPLAAEQPGSFRRAHELALTHLRLAEAHLRVRKLPATDHHLREAIPVLEKHAALAGLGDYLRELADAHQTLADLSTAQDKRPETEDALRRSVAVRERLLAEGPLTTSDAVKLVAAHLQLGNEYLKRERPADADRQFRTAWTVCETFPPDADDHRRTLVGSTAYALAVRLTNEERPADALPWLDRAIATFAGLQGSGNVAARGQLRSARASRAAAYEKLERFAEAILDWDAAIALSEPGDRPALRLWRSYSLARAGRHTDAVRAADELVTAGGWSAEQWYNLGCLFAVVAAKSDDGPKQKHAERAVELLTRAVAAGWNDAGLLKTDPDLLPLHGRDDFKKLVARIDTLHKKDPPRKD